VVKHPIAGCCRANSPIGLNLWLVGNYHTDNGALAAASLISLSCTERDDYAEDHCDGHAVGYLPRFGAAVLSIPLATRAVMQNLGGELLVIAAADQAAPLWKLLRLVIVRVRSAR